MAHRNNEDTRYKDEDDVWCRLSEIQESLHTLNRKVDKVMATQAELDTAAQVLTEISTDVQTNVAQLQTDVANIQQLLNQPQLDATALDAAVQAAANTASNLDSAVQQVSNLAPAPAPTPGG